MISPVSSYIDPVYHVCLCISFCMSCLLLCSFLIGTTRGVNHTKGPVYLITSYFHSNSPSNSRQRLFSIHHVPNPLVFATVFVKRLKLSHPALSDRSAHPSYIFVIFFSYFLRGTQTLAVIPSSHRRLHSYTSHLPHNNG
jgi:hypothetical protein